VLAIDCVPAPRSTPERGARDGQCRARARVGGASGVDDEPEYVRRRRGQPTAGS